MWDWISKLLGSGGGGSGGGGIMGAIGGGSPMGDSGMAGGMEANPTQGAIDAQKYKEFMNNMNSNFMSQSRSQNAASSANDKEFALTEGQRSYHDQFMAPMDSTGIMGALNNMQSQPMQPRNLSGFEVLQQLINGGMR